MHSTDGVEKGWDEWVHDTQEEEEEDLRPVKRRRGGGEEDRVEQHVNQCVD